MMEVVEAVEELEVEGGSCLAVDLGRVSRGHFVSCEVVVQLIENSKDTFQCLTGIFKNCAVVWRGGS